MLLNWPLKSKKKTSFKKPLGDPKIQQIVSAAIDKFVNGREGGERAEKLERGRNKKIFVHVVSWSDYQLFGIHSFGCECYRWRRRRIF